MTSRVVHVVRVEDANQNFVDMKVIDGISFQGPNGKDELLYFKSTAVPLVVDKTGDGNAQNNSSPTRVSHMERFTSSDGTQFFDAEILDAIAVQGPNGKEEVFFMPSVGAVEGSSRAITQTTVTSDDDPSQTIIVKRLNAISFQGINGKDELYYLPGEGNEIDTTKYNGDGSPPANTDKNIYAFFPPDSSGPFVGKPVSQGFLWWIVNAGGGGGVYIVLQVSGNGSVAPSVSFDGLKSGDHEIIFKNEILTPAGLTWWTYPSPQTPNTVWVQDSMVSYDYLGFGPFGFEAVFTPGPVRSAPANVQQNAVDSGIGAPSWWYEVQYNPFPQTIFVLYNLLWQTIPGTDAGTSGYNSLSDALAAQQNPGAAPDFILAPYGTEAEAEAAAATINHYVSIGAGTPSAPLLIDPTPGPGPGAAVDSTDNPGFNFNGFYVLKIPSIPKDSPDDAPVFTLNLGGGSDTSYNINFDLYTIKDNLPPTSAIILPKTTQSPDAPSLDIWSGFTTVSGGVLGGSYPFVLTKRLWHGSPAIPITMFWPTNLLYTVTGAPQVVFNDVDFNFGLWANITGPPSLQPL